MASPTQLHALLPDIQTAICEGFSHVECCIESTPCLSESPFGFAFENLGRRIHLVPTGTAPLKDFHLIASLPEGDVLGDGQTGDTIHLVLSEGEDWRSPIQKLFNSNNESDWALLVLELKASQARFHVLSPRTECKAEPISNTILWMTPLSLAPPKPRLIKKVLVKKTPDKTSTKTTKTVRKKVITKDGVVAISSDLVQRSAINGDSPNRLNPAEKPVKTRETSNKTENGNGIVNGNGNANGEGSGVDSGISLADSDNEKAQHSPRNEKERPDGSANEWVTPCTTPDPGAKLQSRKLSDDVSATFTMTLNGSDEPLANGNGRQENNTPLLSNGNDQPCSAGLSSTSFSPYPNLITTPPKASVEMPVVVLQQVLKQFNFKQSGELRRVHPYWDELCGQALNNGYYAVVKQADKLLTDCQRRVHHERELHKVLTLLTSLQVHILNPIDILRPAMDEGVCCFVYGDLLDQIVGIVTQARRMMKGEYNLDVEWKPVAELARRAQIHYKSNLEGAMEEKLSEVVKLKAIQRIQRIDSFIVDTTVTKLEKAATMARDDLEWEIEQLRQANTQLRKDNRELKKDQMRMESRVEVLENKFKTMARLLQ